MSIDQETKNLATKFVDHLTNKEGKVLANVYESEAFKSLYDPKGVDERKVRLGRRQLQVFNQLNAETSLFQKVYYHPGLLQEDEQQLRTIFWKQN